MMLTEAQAAEFAQVDKRTIRKLIETGRLKAINVGCGSRCHYRITPEDLRQMEPSRSAPTAPPTAARRRRATRAPSYRLSAYLPDA